MRLRWTLIALAAFLVVEMTGCGGSLPPVAGPLDDSSAALAMNFRRKAGLKYSPTKVYFARLEEDEEFEAIYGKWKFLSSNLTQGGRVYLLNAPPGIYYAVAAVTIQVDPRSVTNRANEPVSETEGPTGTRENIQYDYFSEPFIRRTRVEVAPGSFEFMGDFLVIPTSTMDNADRAQRTFRGLLEGDSPGTSPETTGRLEENARGLNLERANQTGGAYLHFQENARRDLAGSRWVDRLPPPPDLEDEEPS